MNAPPFAARLQRGPLAPMLAIVAGVVAAFGFAPFALFPLTLVGLAALIWLCEAAPRRAGVLGWAWGLGHFAFSVRWIAEAFTYQAKMPPQLGWLVVLGLGALLATMPGIACWLTWRLARRAPPLARAWAFPAAWMLMEWVRGHLWTGFPWNPLAAATLDTAGLANTVAVWGTLGVGGVLALFVARIVLGGRRRARWTAVAFVGALGITGLTASIVASWSNAPGPRVVLRIVQPNIGQEEKWAADGGARSLATLVGLSRAPAPSAAPRIILWPEAALAQHELEREPQTRATLAALLRPGDLLMTGGISVSYDSGGNPAAARNRLFVLDHAGSVIATFDKYHLVPGGEYVPLRPLADALGLSRLAPGNLDFTPGSGPRTIALPGLPALGPMICYEMIFPHAVVDEAHRPAWLFNPSNDAWFGGAGPPQHLALARLQAVAEGLPIARSTPTGISALIGPDGGLIAKLPQHKAGVIELPLPAALPPTLYSLYGDTIPAALALMCLALAFRAAHPLPRSART